MTAFTVTDLITEAFGKIGVAGQGNVINGFPLKQGLFNLNLIIDSWNVDGKMIFTETIKQFPVSNGTVSYTFGPGGDWDVPIRPTEIDYASFVLTNSTPNIFLPMDILSAQEWSEIHLIQVPTSVSNKIYIDQNWPLANAYIWPQSTTAQFVRLTYWAPLNASLLATDTFSMPPAYARGLMLNLAANLAPNYGKQMPPDLLATLASLKQQITNANFQPNRLAYDVVIGGDQTYNVLTDQVGRRG